MNLLIDFDRTIHRQKDGYKDGELYDEPNDFTEKALKLLNKKYNVFIFTARDPEWFPQIQNWLKRYGMEKHIHYHMITNIKRGGIIIDDKCIRFTTWKDILNYLTEW